MRNRLIEMIQEAVGGNTNHYALADHLLASGVIVPPCKRGDIVYCIRKDKSRIPFIKEVEVRSVTVYGIDRFSVYTTKDDVWGRTAFATFEEAEKALAERSNENAE